MSAGTGTCGLDGSWSMDSSIVVIGVAFDGGVS
jgi:hypothetical protein